MRLSRIQIQNFRNFKDFDVQLGDHAVILGENKVGKTNLLFALRLLLDPTLPDSMRRLRLEDFWDGLKRPLKADTFIEVSVEFRDFERNENLLAVLADHLVKPDPMVARITYRFQPVAGLTAPPKGEGDYEFVVFGGDRPDNLVGYELRRWMPMDLFPALRDAESDLARWSRSPLRPLLGRAAQTIDAKALAGIAADVHSATSAIAVLPALAGVVASVNTQLKAMVGDQHAIETALGFAPTEPERLLRALQLMIDGGTRGVAEPAGPALSASRRVPAAAGLSRSAAIATFSCRSGERIAGGKADAHFAPRPLGSAVWATGVQREQAVLGQPPGPKLPVMTRRCLRPAASEQVAGAWRQLSSAARDFHLS